MNEEPTFSVVQLRCDLCGELLSTLTAEMSACEEKHRERHRQGTCPECGHWNDEHYDSSRFPAPIAGYHNGPKICGHHIGWGDFCGCGTVKDDC